MLNSGLARARRRFDRRAILLAAITAVLPTSIQRDVSAQVEKKNESKKSAESAGDMIKRSKGATALVNLKMLGSGTAFCVSSDGLFVTNHHVVEHIDPGEKVDMVLNPGEASERRISARLLRKVEDPDLALLKADGVKDLPTLELGDSSALQETAPVTALGYPFGRLMALGGEKYPAVSVNTGRVSALRRKKGKLDIIQIDGSLNPGHSGGPVLDEKGRVVGVIFSGIPRSGLVFAIPQEKLKPFLDEPALIVSIPAITYRERHEPQRFEMEFFRAGPGEAPDEVELIVQRGKKSERTLSAMRDGAKFVVTAPPVMPGSDSAKLKVTVSQDDEEASFECEDQNVTVGSQSLLLSGVRLIERRPDLHIVNTVDGRRFAGRVAGMEKLKAPGEKPKDLLAADRIDVHSAGAIEAGVQYEAIARRGKTVLARVEGAIEFRHPPIVAEHLFDSTDPWSKPVESIVIEALVDGKSDLIVLPDGLAWRHHSWNKPGELEDKRRFVLVNGRKWYPQWSRTEPTEASADVSEMYPLRIGPVAHDTHVLSIQEERGGKHVPERGKVKGVQNEDTEGLLVVTIDDAKSGPAWYRLLLTPTMARYFPPLPAQHNPRGGFWTFDEVNDREIADSSGNKQPARLPVPALAPGRVGLALATDMGSIHCGDVGDFEANDAFSGAAWVNIGASRAMAIFSRMDESQSFRGYDLYVNNGQVFVHILNAWESNSLRVNSTDRIPFHEWHHLAFSYDGSGKAAGVRLYINGKPATLQLTHDGLTGSIRTSSPFRIGARSSGKEMGLGSVYSGRIDEACLFDRVLMPEEVRQLANPQTSANVPPRGIPVTAGLVGAWSFESLEDGKIGDGSGKGHSGAIEARDGAPQIETGRVGQGIRFRGLGTVNCGQAGDFEANEAFSLGAWVRLDSKAPRRSVSVLVKMEGGRPHRGYDLTLDNGRPRFNLISVDRYANDEQSAAAIVHDTVLPVNEWHHLLATYDGSSRAAGMKLYVDGKLVPTKTPDGYDSLVGTIRTPAPLFIGSWAQGGFPGTIDEVIVVDRALTAAEAARLAEGRPLEK